MAGETGFASASAVIVDWGGVLTQPFDEAIALWAAAEGVDPGEFGAVLGRLLGPDAKPGGGPNPFHRVERGDMPVAAFESALAALVRRTDGTSPPADGLVQRMFAHFAMEPAMAGLLRRVRGAGVPVALLSNSWGHRYDRDGWDELFDAVVISCEVGMRKPEPEIFRHTARQLDRRPEECVFVDDLGRNVRAARALGMTAVHHRTAAETAEALTPLLRVSGRTAAP
ncbi:MULTISPECIES: HAD family phosphatase [unclassified Streptomyces]|uniref:HAD family hydrolase n=1 Tax=unclassified Streptomyces TaxID=2593676 RepID=UPI0033FBD490